MGNIGFVTLNNKGRGHHQREACEGDGKQVEGDSSDKHDATCDGEALVFRDFSNGLIGCSKRLRLGLKNRFFPIFMVGFDDHQNKNAGNR